MSRRRSGPRAMKARARFDLLFLVILAAFITSFPFKEGLTPKATWFPDSVFLASWFPDSIFMASWFPDSVFLASWFPDSILNPGFLIRPGVLTLTEQTDPRSQQPPRDEPSDANVDGFPNHYRHHPVCNRAANDQITSSQKVKMQGRNDKEPAKEREISLNEFAMSANSSS